MGPTHYSYIVTFQLPKLLWEDWKIARDITDDMLEFASFIGAWDISLKMVSGSPFGFLLTFCDKKKRLEFYRSAFTAAFPSHFTGIDRRGREVDFRNWSVIDECDTTIDY